MSTGQTETETMSTDLRDFLAGYVDCLLWVESIGDDYAAQHERETGEDTSGDTSLQSFGFSREDVDVDALASMAADCRSFLEDNADDLEQYCDEVGPWEGTDSRGFSRDPAMARAGHDFYLTRGGHGAGFWDRGLGELGDRLADAARAYGEVWAYVGDDGRVYSS